MHSIAIDNQKFNNSSSLSENYCDSCKEEKELLDVCLYVCYSSLKIIFKIFRFKILLVVIATLKRLCNYF